MESWRFTVKFDRSIYELLGGDEGLRRLVEAFYPKVQRDPLIGPLFPENIDPVMEKQYMFLSQFPMMRARHMPFPITHEKADAWLACMNEALTDIGVEDELRVFIIDRLSGPAHHFVNTN